MNRFLLISLLFWTVSAAIGQEATSLRLKSVIITSERTFLDSSLISPVDFEVVGFDTASYRLSTDGHSLLWLSLPYPQDSVVVRYRIFPSFFTDTFRRKDPDLMNNYYRENPFSYVPKDERYMETTGDDIKTLGNISRGVGFGNRQDITVNSNLNLRLSGMIQNEVSILAAISDDNNPIQPEGNTQQIQDFDRVFVQLNRDSTELIAGDFLMTTPVGSYFMKYNKKSRGAQFHHQQELKKGRLSYSGEAAISRGRFARNTINGIEGNQGPYRLSGQNGEVFIIIISGTEQVYLDGELLLRGEQNDYVIDYNTGEVTFMPSRLITQYSRIVVEFQYSDRNYARSVFRGGGSYDQGNWSVRLNYFSEQDNRNQPFQINLDLFDSINMLSARDVLAQAGDVENAFISTADSAGGYDPSRIQYYRFDSLGTIIYIHAVGGEDSTREYYNLSFSFVGAGNGNYVQKISDANGKVFEWVAPVAGQPMGDYEPVEVLIAPKRLQMLTFGVDYQLAENSIATVEFARTDNDINTFSSLDSDDDIGYAILTRLQHESSLKVLGLPKWQVNSVVSLEQTQSDFRYVERYRGVEFDRRWNRTLTNSADQFANANEQIVLADIYVHRNKKFWMRTNQSYYRRGAQSGGYSRNYGLGVNRKNIRAQVVSDRVSTFVGIQGESVQNEFYNYSASIDYPGKRIAFGGSYSWESSDFGSLGDTLYGQSYRFDRRTLYAGSGDSTSFNWKLQANQRTDYKADEGNYTENTDGRDLNLSMTWRADRSTAIQFTGTYRQLDYADSATPLEQTVQGRLDLKKDLIKRVIQTQTYFQLGTGQEQRREFAYLEVGDGNGAYIWNDYDSNGIQSLNEFEIASEFDRGRANFIRQFLPVQGFIKAYSSEFNGNIRVRPERVWNRKEVGLKRFIGRFSNVTSLKVLKRVTNNESSDYLNPFSDDVADTALLSTNSVIRSVWSFNQSSPIFGIDYQWFRTNGKQLLVNGVDQRTSLENKLKVRYNIKRNWEVNLTGNMGNRRYVAGFLTDRSFDYEFNSIRPQVGYLFKQSLRVQVYYEYFEAQNQPEFGSEQTFNHNFTTEMRVNLVNRGSIRLALGMVNINYTGNDNSPVAYELLAGLRNGRNAKWNLQIEQRFSNSIQVLVSYDGRKSLENPVIHIGRVQARYLF